MSSIDAHGDERSKLLARFGSNVRRARSTRVPPLSQEDLASVAGLHRNVIYKIEQGAVNPRFSTLLALADGLGVSLDELCEGLESPIEHEPLPADVGRPKGA